MMNMVTAKERILEIIKHLPDDRSADDIVRELAFDLMVRRGLKDSDERRTISNEEMERRLTPKTCLTCGRPLDDGREHGRHIRFKLPEPVLDIPKEERPARTWGNDVVMMVRDLGSFVRILIPVNCSAGYTVTYSAWLSVPAADLKHAWKVWSDTD